MKDPKKVKEGVSNDSKGPDPTRHEYRDGKDAFSPPPVHELNLGDYARPKVSNLNDESRVYFDTGLRLMHSYQHEMAAKCFLYCLQSSPYCALAHGLVALCHSPNYNFKGEAYYESACHYDDAHKPDLLCVFPSQQVADRHSRQAIETMEEIRRLIRQRKKQKKKAANVGGPAPVADVESQLLHAIRILTGMPGVDPTLSNEIVGRPFADAMSRVYEKHSHDPDVAYWYAESLMVLNAWQLYEYPSGQPFSPDVPQVRQVLESTLALHPLHAGLCHMYVHLSEMSAHPEQALHACQTLRRVLPDAGHLLHMPTHIDVLLGDYPACVEFNRAAIVADRRILQLSPETAGRESFYFGYMVHNYHMAVYGCILGAFEHAAMELAAELNESVNEDMFTEFPDLVAYLEAYSALEIHTMVRFGRWKELLEVELPRDQHLMLFRSAQILYAKSIAHAALGNVTEAKREASRLDSLRQDPDAEFRILHNNSVADLLKVDAMMMRGEIAYAEGKYEEAFQLLRKAVVLQDTLNYDEPWGKMQPIRHALGGLLYEQGHVEEAEKVFREDLKYHPRNPWAMLGLLKCLQSKGSCCNSTEVGELETQLREQRQCQLADFEVEVPCECCTRR